VSSARRNIFVLSGGGSRGAGQVGMLRALLAAGVVPDQIVAGSVGSLNGCYLGVDPTPARVEQLAEVWAAMRASTLTGPRRSMVANLATMRPYLFSNRALRQLVARLVSTHRLEDLAVPVRVATTDLLTGLPAHHDTGYLPDLLCASAALPGMLPPVRLAGGRAHVDAGVAENVPLSGVAGVAAPGDRVWILDVTKCPNQLRQLRTPVDVLVAALAGSITNRPAASVPAGVEVVHLKLDEAYDCGPVFDFSHTATLIRMGEQAAHESLALEAPLAS
jgi:NTE family protein